MKVLIPIKRVIDPYVKIRVLPEQQTIDAQHAKRVINPFDEIALEEAIRWKETGIASELTAISIGPQAVQETLRNALALGADKAIHILTDEVLEPLTIAKILKNIVLQYNPHIVIMGKQAIDDDCNQTGQMLAGLLDWPQATFASKIVFTDDKTRCNVSREVDEGIETLQVVLPAVITTDLRLNEPRYASLPNIMKAKQKPLEQITLASMNVDVKPRVKKIALNPPPVRSPGKMVQDVAELVHFLRDIEKVI
jgi:electron transfer flavoprotein beta subunit